MLYFLGNLLPLCGQLNSVCRGLFRRGLGRSASTTSSSSLVISQVCGLMIFSPGATWLDWPWILLCMSSKVGNSLSARCSIECTCCICASLETAVGNPTAKPMQFTSAQRNGRACCIRCSFCISLVEKPTVKSWQLNLSHLKRCSLFVFSLNSEPNLFFGYA